MATTDLDELVFSDAVPPELPASPDPIISGDIAPPTDDVLSCKECGAALTYSGRGRKPLYCDDHKKGGNKRSSSTTRATPNDKLARQATAALVQLNRLTGFGARMVGLAQTSEMIMFAESSFEEQAYEALLTDPDLCKQILAVGHVSAKFSLITAYALLLGQVAPVAMLEIKAKRAEKAEATE